MSSLDISASLRVLDLVDLLALPELRIMQFLDMGATTSVHQHLSRSSARTPTIFASRFAIDTAFSFSRTFSSGSVISVSFVRMRSSTRTTRSSSRSVTKLTATPPLPLRAVRPTRCVYSSGSSGMSQFTTSATSSMSSPRAPTSVETSTGTTLARKSESELSRSRWVRRECRAVARMWRVWRSEVRYAAVRGRRQKMIVGGGCSISSGSAEVVFDFLGFDFECEEDLRCLEGLTGSGGARRRCRVDSGGLQRR